MKDFLQTIKDKSPYYAKLWGDHALELSSLPIVEQDSFWSANTWDNNRLLTAPIDNGVVFKSGGTTGRPKFSVFTKREWEEFTRIFGASIANVVTAGDRVGNVFYAGELYASFLFIEKSLEYCPTSIVTFPIAGATDLAEMIKLVKNYKVNVLAGVPTTFIRLAQLLLDRGETLKLDKILYGGESLFNDQRPLLEQAFEAPQIVSVGYASVDAGHLGGSAPELGAGIHRVLEGTVMQIIDEQGCLIENTQEGGRLLMTNLTRQLMPIIRYPVGDMAKWVVYGESFEILGRADEGARVGPVTINRDDIVSVLAKLNVNPIFQLILTREGAKDQLIIRYLGELNNSLALEQLLSERVMLKDSIEKGLIACPRFESSSELERNPRTGKLKLVVDQRF